MKRFLDLQVLAPQRRFQLTCPEGSPNGELCAQPRPREIHGRPEKLVLCQWGVVSSFEAQHFLLKPYGDLNCIRSNAKSPHAQNSQNG
jgi:hypothetical protein